MIRRLALAVLSASLLTLVATALPAAADARKRNVVSDGYIVVYENSVRNPSGETEQREREEGFKSRLRYSRALKGFAARLSPEQVRELRADADVDYVVPDRIVRATGTLVSGEPLPPTGTRRIEAASASHAHAASTANVAVIDTGVDLTHPDLNAAAGRNCVTPGASPTDDNGHGTHVAGTIAAENDGAGVVGVAPGTKLFAAKVLNAQGSGTASQVICGIDWVTSTRTDSDPGNDIAVANMSLGGTGYPLKSCDTTTDPEHQAICRSTQAGVTYVVAAGNSGWDFDYASAPDTPAAYPQVLTVTAASDSDGLAGATGGSPSCRTSEKDDSYASFSNYALTSAGAAHTIAAPGVCIKSTWMNGGYSTISGTSMATPQMAGVAALCLGEEGASSAGACAGLTPAQIVAKLRGDAQSHTGSVSGYGFNGDPLRPVGSRFYGYLTWVGVEGSPPVPTPATLKSYSPVGYSPFIGSVYSGRGAISRLATNDGNRVEITATSQSGTYVSEIQPYATISATELSTLRKLTVDFDGSVSSSSATLTVQVRNVATGAWETIYTQKGSTYDRSASWTTSTSPARYVDGAGTIRVRVRGTRSGGSFRTMTDLVRFRIEY